MFDWNQAVTIDGDVQITFPLVNFAGKIYLTYADEFLSQQLDITPDEKVLDIGGGSRPFARADVVTEAFIDDNMHRSGISVDKGLPYVRCFAEKLPFRDKEFDVAVSRHVFEHVIDPDKACREMMRVARRGFIETPGYYNALLSDYPAHRWNVYKKKGKLIFEKKKYLFNPFRNAVRGFYYANLNHRTAMDFSFRNLACTQYYWETGFEYEILDSGGGFDYDNKESAALAHLDYAVNSLKYGNVPPEEIMRELKTAVSLWPRLTLNSYFKKLSQWEKFREKNCYGKVFPLVPEYYNVLRKQINISDPAKILEIGDNQIIKGSYFIPCQRIIEDENFLSGLTPKFEYSLVRGLPAKHSRPHLLFQQLATVSRKGMIEVPSLMWEYFNGDSENIWLFDVSHGSLHISPKNFNFSPFPGVISFYTSSYPEIKTAFEVNYRNLTYIQFHWENNINFQ